ncbi:putative Bifunctional methylenetetrahydrofolate dehydrogenase-cyclohydrolase [Naja naja]|nr:putative Bifunctional methylenetetrahydrofolate dehydrogenase-cyclohydrolase [Naja naja]
MALRGRGRSFYKARFEGAARLQSPALRKVCAAMAPLGYPHLFLRASARAAWGGGGCGCRHLPRAARRLHLTAPRAVIGWRKPDALLGTSGGRAKLPGGVCRENPPRLERRRRRESKEEEGQEKPSTAAAQPEANPLWAIHSPQAGEGGTWHWGREDSGRPALGSRSLQLSCCCVWPPPPCLSAGDRRWVGGGVCTNGLGCLGRPRLNSGKPEEFLLCRNEAVVISGQKLARQIRREACHEVEQWVAAGHKRPHLSVVLVGENPASHSYVLNKTRAAADVGISSETILKPASVTEEELLDLIVKLNHDANVDGLLVQLPLPEHIDERKICNAVNPEKDVDGFHVVNNVVVAGRSKNVGMPIAMLLHTDGRHERPGGDATVTISHRYTPKEQLKQHTILADIVVAAAGIPNLITADMIKEGAAVIDVGINRIQDPVTAKPKLVGDVDFEGVKQKASYITPVPGGVGPMTVAMLMKNTIIAAKKMLRAQHLETFSA